MTTAGGGAQAQVAQSTTIAGTVLDSVGAPPPLGSTVQLVLPVPLGSPARPRYCANGTTDTAGNFHLTLVAFVAGCATPGAQLQLRVNDVPAMQTVTVPAGGGVYFAAFTLAVPLGGQPLTSSTLAAARFTLLAVGCSQVVLSLGVGASPGQVAAALADPSALIAIWHFDNGSHRFSAYFADPAAPSDLTALAAADAVFVCVSTATSILSP